MPFPWSEKDFRQRVGSGKVEIHFNLFLLVELAISDLYKGKQKSLVLIMQSTWVVMKMIFIEGIDPLSIPPFFRPKFGCWNNSWEFHFFLVKNIHRLSGFLF